MLLQDGISDNNAHTAQFCSARRVTIETWWTSISYSSAQQGAYAQRLAALLQLGLGLRVRTASDHEGHDRDMVDEHHLQLGLGLPLRVTAL